MFRFSRTRKPVQTPVHPNEQFATVLTASQLDQYEAITAAYDARQAMRQAVR